MNHFLSDSFDFWAFLNLPTLSDDNLIFPSPNFLFISSITLINLEFSSKDLAIEYAKKNKIDYEVIEPKKRTVIKKSYTDNFLK